GRLLHIALDGSGDRLALLLQAPCLLLESGDRMHRRPGGLGHRAGRHVGHPVGVVVHRLGDLFDLELHTLLTSSVALPTTVATSMTHCAKSASRRASVALDEALGELTEDVDVGDLAPLLGLDRPLGNAVPPDPDLEVPAQPD